MEVKGAVLIAVLIIGSLLWDKEKKRPEWRRKRLVMKENIFKKILKME